MTQAYSRGCPIVVVWGPQVVGNPVVPSPYYPSRLYEKVDALQVFS